VVVGAARCNVQLGSQQRSSVNDGLATVVKDIVVVYSIRLAIVEVAIRLQTGLRAMGC